MHMVQCIITASLHMLVYTQCMARCTLLCTPAAVYSLISLPTIFIVSLNDHIKHAYGAVHHYCIPTYACFDVLKIILAQPRCSLYSTYNFLTVKHHSSLSTTIITILV